MRFHLSRCVVLFCIVFFQGGSSALLPKEVPTFPVVDSVVVMSRSFFYPVYLLETSNFAEHSFCVIEILGVFWDLFACVNCIQ